MPVLFAWAIGKKNREVQKEIVFSRGLYNVKGNKHS